MTLEVKQGLKMKKRAKGNEACDLFDRGWLWTAVAVEDKENTRLHSQDKIRKMHLQYCR